MNEEDLALFRQSVYEVVAMIPCGRATSYGAIAKAIGYPNFSRLVGRVMGTYDSSINHLPAHRVVNNQGILSGKIAFGHYDEMEKLLESEGIVVTNDKIKNWKKVFWNPLEEINL